MARGRAVRVRGFRGSGVRVGEGKGSGESSGSFSTAQHGPNAQGEGDLDSRPSQTVATLAYEETLWQMILSCCLSCVSDPRHLFSQCPVLAAMAPRAYGNHCSTGQTLSGCRHTIIAVQNRFFGAKPFMYLAGDMLSRWEALAPPQPLSHTGTSGEGHGV